MSKVMNNARNGASNKEIELWETRIACGLTHGPADPTVITPRKTSQDSTLTLLIRWYNNVCI